jgi:DNA-binding Lrp family transcriptional regulator
MNVFSKQKLNKNTTDEYMKQLSNKYPSGLFKGVLKVNDGDLKIPTISTCDNLLLFNYSLSQLKGFAKFYKLKVGGDKNELNLRIYSYLQLSECAIKVQKIVRGRLHRYYVTMHGPASRNNSLCTNDCDFITMDPFNKISFHQFISYKDDDGFVYGFDIASIYNLIIKTGCETNKVKNPYTRTIIPITLYERIKKLIKYGFILRYEINLNIENDAISISQPKALELRALELFQNIDSLGNYSDCVWFLSLNRNQLLQFVRHVNDIFEYRAQLTNEVKRNICPPSGNPFWNTNIIYLQVEEDVNIIKTKILDVLEKLVNSGINHDSKSLGAYYVLAALTLVNETAAAALPWLYESVVTNY